MIHCGRGVFVSAAWPLDENEGADGNDALELEIPAFKNPSFTGRFESNPGELQPQRPRGNRLKPWVTCVSKVGKEHLVLSRVPSQESGAGRVRSRQ